MRRFVTGVRCNSFTFLFVSVNWRSTSSSETSVTVVPTARGKILSALRPLFFWLFLTGLAGGKQILVIQNADQLVGFSYSITLFLLAEK
jgi:hypothetical protein